MAETPPPARIIRSIDLLTRICGECAVAENASRFQFWDDSYWIPSQAWLLGRFSELCRTEFAARHPGSERWDCDDAALQTLVMARRANADRRATDKAGIAVGVVSGQLASGFTLNGIPGPGGHATNLVLTEQGLCYFEPQTGKATPVSQVSCFDYEVRFALF